MMFYAGGRDWEGVKNHNLIAMGVADPNTEKKKERKKEKKRKERKKERERKMESECIQISGKPIKLY